MIIQLALATAAPLCAGPSALEFVGPRNLGLLTPAGKSARRGPRFGLGWYVNGPSALAKRHAACLSKTHNHLRGFFRFTAFRVRMTTVGIYANYFRDRTLEHFHCKPLRGLGSQRHFFPRKMALADFQLVRSDSENALTHGYPRSPITQ